MRISYASTYEASDIRKWSGLVHFIAKALQEQEIELVKTGTLGRYHKLANAALSKIGKHAFNAPFPVERTFAYASVCAKAIAKHQLTHQTQAIFSPSTIPLARYTGPAKSISYTDATFRIVQEQYPEMKQYPKRYLREGEELENRAMCNIDALVFSSQWAANSAVNDHGADACKTHVVPFGSNLNIPISKQELEAGICGRSAEQCELIFLAVRWMPKGGDVLMRVADKLRAKGIPIRVTVLGCIPPLQHIPDWMHVTGYVDKNSIQGHVHMAKLLMRSHFMILPSKIDCTPVAFSECASLGLPCLSSKKVGGIAEIVRDEVNGATFDVDDADAYAEFIAEKWNNKSAYEALAHSSRMEYEQRLNWQVSGAALKRIIQSNL